MFDGVVEALRLIDIVENVLYFVLAVLVVLVKMSDIYIYPYHMCICQVIEIN